MLRTTLAKNLENLNTRYQSLKVQHPTSTKIRLTRVPQFYSEDLIRINHQQINCFEYLENEVKYHYLESNSYIDQTAPSDMVYPYHPEMQIIRDLNLKAARSYFSQTFSAAVVGNQAIIRLLRFAKEVNNASLIACDRKKNFEELAKYHMNLNSIERVKLEQADVFEFLSLKKAAYHFLDLEVSYRTPAYMIMPMLHAVKDNGLICYSIVQGTHFAESYSSTQEYQFGIHDNHPEDVAEGTLRIIMAKISRQANQLGKSVELLNSAIAGNSHAGHLTLQLRVKSHSTIAAAKHAENSGFLHKCKICKQIFDAKSLRQASCHFQNCEIAPIGPYYQGDLFNKQFLQKCLKDTSGSRNQVLLNKLLLQSIATPLGLRCFNYRYFAQDFAKTFPESIQVPNFTTLPSPMSNRSVWTNLPHSDLMGFVKSFVLMIQPGYDHERMAQKSREYFQGVEPKPLANQKLQRPIRLILDQFKYISGLPREIRKERQKDYGWDQ